MANSPSKSSSTYCSPTLIKFAVEKPRSFQSCSPSANDVAVMNDAEPPTEANSRSPERTEFEWPISVCSAASTCSSSPSAAGSISTPPICDEEKNTRPEPSTTGDVKSVPHWFLCSFDHSVLPVFISKPATLA